MTYHPTAATARHTDNFSLSTASSPDQPIHLPARTRLQRQSEARLEPCEILRGIAVVSCHSPKWGEAVVDIIGPGSLVGGAGPGSANCTIVAATDMLVQPLGAAAGAALAHRLDMELTRQRERGMMVAQATAVERVAFFLLTLAAPPCRAGQSCTGCTLTQTAIKIPITRKEMAGVLALTVETISRCFARLREEGVIAGSNPNRVMVLDPVALIAYGGDGAIACTGG
jgi:CRP/FNR family transcriptional regulator